LFRTKHFFVVEFHHHDRKHGKPDAQERAGLALKDQCFFSKSLLWDFRYGIVGYLFDSRRLFCMKFAKETKRIRRPTFRYEGADVQIFQNQKRNPEFSYGAEVTA
jgi:hypothetical protein